MMRKTGLEHSVGTALLNAGRKKLAAELAKTGGADTRAVQEALEGRQDDLVLARLKGQLSRRTNALAAAYAQAGGINVTTEKPLEPVLVNGERPDWAASAGIGSAHPGISGFEWLLGDNVYGDSSPDRGHAAPDIGFAALYERQVEVSYGPQASFDVENFFEPESYDPQKLVEAERAYFDALARIQRARDERTRTIIQGLR
jgi:hypothetical protein